MGSSFVNRLARPHLLNIKPYSSARDEYTGKSQVYLDANENALGSVGSRELSRYPDPHQRLIKEKLSQIKEIAADQIFIGNGSDEPIDLLIRAFCNPGKDEVIIMPPTYGMYEVSANINEVGVNRIPLTHDFQLNVEAVLESVTSATKMIFVCNPNNPTGTRIDDRSVVTLLEKFEGLVVVDEAYIDFSNKESFISRIASYENLAVLQTFSKAWGLAAARVGMLFGSKNLIDLINKIKPPYNVNEMSQGVIIRALDQVDQKDRMVGEILEAKEHLETGLRKIGMVEQIHDSDTNFLLVRMPDPVKVYHYLIEQGIIVRDRSKVLLCEGCLRITVGTPKENEKLLMALGNYR